MWLAGEELLIRADLLPSVPAFFKAWALKEFTLPSAAGQPLPTWCELP